MCILGIGPVCVYVQSRWLVGVLKGALQACKGSTRERDQLCGILEGRTMKKTTGVRKVQVSGCRDSEIVRKASSTLSFSFARF